MYFYASSFTFRLFVLDLFWERNYQQSICCASPSSLSTRVSLLWPLEELHKLLSTTDLILLKADLLKAPVAHDDAISVVQVALSFSSKHTFIKDCYFIC